MMGKDGGRRGFCQFRGVYLKASVAVLFSSPVVSNFGEHITTNSLPTPFYKLDFTCSTKSLETYIGLDYSGFVGANAAAGVSELLKESSVLVTYTTKCPTRQRSTKDKIAI